MKPCGYGDDTGSSHPTDTVDDCRHKPGTKLGSRAISGVNLTHFEREVVPMSLPSAEARSATTRVTRTFAFIDLCGFTDFSDSHCDDAAVGELVNLRASVRAAAPLFGVRVDKWLGDGVMLVGVDVEPVVAAVA